MECLGIIKTMLGHESQGVRTSDAQRASLPFASAGRATTPVHRRHREARGLRLLQADGRDADAPRPGSGTVTGQMLSAERRRRRVRRVDRKLMEDETLRIYSLESVGRYGQEGEVDQTQSFPEMEETLRFLDQLRMDCAWVVLYTSY